MDLLIAHIYTVWGPHSSSLTTVGAQGMICLSYPSSSHILVVLSHLSALSFTFKLSK